MSDNDMRIIDDQALYDLNNELEYTADSLLKVEESVESYFGGVKEALEKQLELLRERLEEAEEELAAAEEDLSSCEASQTCDEDGNYTPSCASEERAAQAARRKVEECRRKYEAGREIVNNCQSEWDTYHKPYSFLSPAGGHDFIDHAANKHTDEATETLKQVIEINNRYLQKNFGGESANPVDRTNLSHVRPENVPLTKDQQEHRREGMVMQVNREFSAPKVAANRVMVCPTCGRPYAMCICTRKKDNVEFLKKE